jgi:hypothetical protein
MIEHRPDRPVMMWWANVEVLLLKDLYKKEKGLRKWETDRWLTMRSGRDKVQI